MALGGVICGLGHIVARRKTGDADAQLICAKNGLVPLPESEREAAEQEVGEIERGVLWAWLVAE